MALWEGSSAPKWLLGLILVLCIHNSVEQKIVPVVSTGMSSDWRGEVSSCDPILIHECSHYHGSIETVSPSVGVRRVDGNTTISATTFSTSLSVAGRLTLDATKLALTGTDPLVVENGVDVGNDVIATSNVDIRLANDIQLQNTPADTLRVTANTLTNMPGHTYVQGSVQRGGTDHCAPGPQGSVGNTGGGSVKLGLTSVHFKADCDISSGDADLEVETLNVADVSKTGALSVNVAADTDIKIDGVSKLHVTPLLLHAKTTNTNFAGTGPNNVVYANEGYLKSVSGSYTIEVDGGTEAGRVLPNAYQVTKGAFQFSQSLGAMPTCTAGIRGRVFVRYGGTGVGDIYYICRKDAADAYAWSAISPASAGPVGPKGIKGVKGNQGTQGAKGLKGSTGPVGPQGAAGAVGQKGAMGIAGDKQNKGAVGAKGPVGPKGPVGAGGDTGTAGPTGPAGDTGDIGHTASCGALTVVSISGSGPAPAQTILQFYSGWIRIMNACNPAAWGASDHGNLAVGSVYLDEEPYLKCNSGFFATGRGRLCVLNGFVGPATWGVAQDTCVKAGARLCNTWDAQLAAANAAGDLSAGYYYTSQDICSVGMWLGDVIASTNRAMYVNSQCGSSLSNFEGQTDKTDSRLYRCCYS